MAVNWQQVRSQFPVLEKWVYLNSASFGPVPTCAREAVSAHLQHRDDQACLDFLDWYTEAEEVREQAAKLIGASASDVAFVPNTATGLAWLMNGIDWQPGDHILALPQEFPNNIYFPKVLEQRGIRFTEACLPDGRFSLEEFLSHLTDRTKLVLMSAMNYSTGLRPPLEELGKALRIHKVLFYLDGTQGVGALQMDVQAVGADVMVVNGYKWMMCPSGIGFAYLRPEVREWLAPSLYSWRSHKNWRDVDHLHHGLPELPSSAMKYEGGMLNFSGIFAMGAVLRLLESVGPESVEERVMHNARETRDVLRSFGGELLYDRHPYYDSPIVSAQFQGVDMSKLAVELNRRRIAVAARKGHLRVSPHFFNNNQDLERLSEVLAAAVKA